ncbi:hypothetical protein [Massilia haematophila]|uniref:PRTRC system protein E n=1 Tax=Massilia haematophila TaxID=457923 RepID=A0ABV7PPN2_9BURK
MTNKAIPAAKLTSEVISQDAQAAEVPAIEAGQPKVISLVGPSYRILAQVVALARQGFTFDSNVPVNLFPATGQIDLTMVLGDPEKADVDEAAKLMADAFELERYTAEQLEKAAASQRAEEVARVAKQAEIAAQIAEAEKVVRALKRQIDKVAA